LIYTLGANGMVTDYFLLAITSLYWHAKHNVKNTFNLKTSDNICVMIKIDVDKKILSIVSCKFMSGQQKLIQKCLEEPGKITMDECDRLLRAFGYEPRKKRGTECVYHKKGSQPINVPTPKKSPYVKSFYVKRFSELLRLEECLENE